ncbi:MAG: hypothetical protein KF691_11625 [Phycisphaeraceae bacterium]|nr:hypothetical protein [Phycisphaeraceae bacterium]
MRNLAKSVVLVASFGIAISTCVFADPPATDPVAAYTNANGNMPGLKQLLPTFDFQGGTVTEFVDALRLAARPRELNIIVLDPMPDVKIAPVKLRNISVEGALFLLRGPLTSSAINVEWTIPENPWDNPVVYIKRPNTVASEMAQRAAQEQRRKTAVLSLQIGPQKKGDEETARNAQIATTLDAVSEALNQNVQPGNRSAAIDLLRRRVAFQIRERGAARSEVSDPRLRGTHSPADGDFAALTQALATLSPDDQLLLRLRADSSASFEQLTSSLGGTPDSLYGRARRALARLRALLSEENVDA